VEWPIVTAHLAVGTILAAGLSGLTTLYWRDAILGAALWVICLNGGTLAINSAFDEDTGDVAYLRKPPHPPRYLFAFGAMLIGFGLGAMMALPRAYQLAYGACAVLSFLYSVPPVRLKAVAGLDWLINLWGFGILTAFAGWAATAIPVSPAGRIVLLAFGPLFGGLYPLTQLYQLEEDRRRGDRTFASVLGPRGSLILALGCVLIAFGMMAVAGLIAGWRSLPDGAIRWTALGLAALSWGMVLIPWTVQAPGLEPRGHQRRMYRALVAWAVTDAVVVFGFAR
jgi:4-hydroxybenzoate polyprenyltransferase